MNLSRIYKVKEVTFPALKVFYMREGGVDINLQLLLKSDKNTTGIYTMVGISMRLEDPKKGEFL